MSFQRGSACPPAVEVERHAAGEEIAERGHVEGCSSCGAHVRELQQASAAFAKQRPAELFLAQLERRERQPAHRPLLWWLWRGAGVLVAASLAIFVAPRLFTTPGEEVRLKGASVEVYLKRGPADPVRLLDGASLRPGDTLRFRYRGGQRAHLMLIERDGAGAVTVFAPFGGSRSVERAPDEFFADAISVDDTAGPAKLFVIQRPEQFEAAPLLEAVRAAQQPSCADCTVDVLHYEKVP